MDPSPSPADPLAAPGAGHSAGPAAASEDRPYSLTALRWRGVPVLTLVLLGFAFSIVVTNYLPTRAATATSDRALEAQRAQNREYADRIRRAEAEAERLERDPWLHERILRDELRMSRQGEVIIR